MKLLYSKDLKFSVRISRHLYYKAITKYDKCHDIKIENLFWYHIEESLRGSRRGQQALSILTKEKKYHIV